MMPSYHAYTLPVIARYCLHTKGMGQKTGIGVPVSDPNDSVLTAPEPKHQ